MTDWSLLLWAGTQCNVLSFTDGESTKDQQPYKMCIGCAWSRVGPRHHNLRPLSRDHQSAAGDLRCDLISDIMADGANKAALALRQNRKLWLSACRSTSACVCAELLCGPGLYLTMHACAYLALVRSCACTCCCSAVVSVNAKSPQKSFFPIICNSRAPYVVLFKFISLCILSAILLATYYEKILTNIPLNPIMCVK